MFSFASFCRLLGIFALSVFASAPVLAQCPSGDPKRGLLANDVFRAQPMKAVYFFPGEARPDQEQNVYTAHPTFEDDKHWLSQLSTRAGVIDRMLGANINVVAISYWGDMPQWSPMETRPTPLQDLFNAAAGRRILILPALESGSDKDHPETPFFEFHQDFPYSANQLAPKLQARIR